MLWLGVIGPLRLVQARLALLVKRFFHVIFVLSRWMWNGMEWNAWGRGRVWPALCPCVKSVLETSLKVPWNPKH